MATEINDVTTEELRRVADLSFKPREVVALLRLVEAQRAALDAAHNALHAGEATRGFWYDRYIDLRGKVS